ncbi:selenoprotein K [Pimephales promelas]|nr:selenoprotein K [Pimephales promelas]
MVYVSNGQVLDGRSRWRLSVLSDLFWTAVEFIGLFFQTLIQPDLSKDGHAGSSSRFSDGRGYSSWVPGPQTDGPNKPRRRSHSSTRGRRWMRTVNACTLLQALRTVTH